MDKELIEELYNSLIKEHSGNPRNHVKNEEDIVDCPFCKHGHNSSCGDQLKLCLSINDNQINNIKFSGEGCALFLSSASFMTQYVKNKTLEETYQSINDFIEFILEEDIILSDKYEPLHIYDSIKNFPLRVKCVLLPWRTLTPLIKENLNV